jgi:hypothetical protein
VLLEFILDTVCYWIHSSFCGSLRCDEGDDGVSS